MQRPLPAPHVVPTDDSGVDGTSLHPALTASLHPINTSMSGTFISPSLQCGRMRAGTAAGTGGSLASSSGKPSGVLRLRVLIFPSKGGEAQRGEAARAPCQPTPLVMEPRPSGSSGFEGLLSG